MPSVKRLKSVAHNLVHRFGSTLHYFEKNYGINHLFGLAKANGILKVNFDILGGRITPAAIGKDKKGQSCLDYLKETLLSELGKNEFSPDQITVATVGFQFSESSNPAVPEYTCDVDLETSDNRSCRVKLTFKSHVLYVNR